MKAKLNTASGMPLRLRQNGIGSRSTGKERDSETGLDFFLARYYSSAEGRFITPDWAIRPEPVPYAKLDNPQTLNLYIYVQNNPLSRTDPDGHEDDEARKKKALIPLAKISINTVLANKDNLVNITLDERTADIPGGKILHLIGINHQWITTEKGKKIGMGNEKGVPQSDLPGAKTQIVDHKGDVSEKSTTFRGLDEKALATYTVPGTPTGRWIPGLNDCNTWAKGVITNSTPHDVQVGNFGVVHNAVRYSDSSVHVPGDE